MIVFSYKPTECFGFLTPIAPGIPASRTSVNRHNTSGPIVRPALDTAAFVVTHGLKHHRTKTQKLDHNADIFRPDSHYRAGTCPQIAIGVR